MGPARKRNSPQQFPYHPQPYQPGPYAQPHCGVAITKGGGMGTPLEGGGAGTT